MNSGTGTTPSELTHSSTTARRWCRSLKRTPRSSSWTETRIPDIHGKVPGAATQGHQVIAAPYDAREAGPLIHRLRKTMRETSFMGMPIMAGADLHAFLNLSRSARAAFHAGRRLARHLLHLAIHGRAMYLVNGVALVARLAASAERLGVTMIESAPAVRLIVEDGAVRGIVIAGEQGGREIRASRGVVLACGGFPPNDVRRRKALFPRTPTGHEHLALPPQACTGDGITLGESAGGPGWPPTWLRRWPGRRCQESGMRTGLKGTFPTSSTAPSRA